MQLLGERTSTGAKCTDTKLCQVSRALVVRRRRRRRSCRYAFADTRSRARRPMHSANTHTHTNSHVHACGRLSVSRKCGGRRELKLGRRRKTAVRMVYVTMCQGRACLCFLSLVWCILCHLSRFFRHAPNPLRCFDTICGICGLCLLL